MLKKRKKKKDWGKEFKKQYEYEKMLFKKFKY